MELHHFGWLVLGVFLGSTISCILVGALASAAKIDAHAQGVVDGLNAAERARCALRAAETGEAPHGDMECAA